MAVHWTDFPERVETFGDLLNIFETFEHDLRARLVHSGSCDNETDASAYSVEFVDGGRFLPQPERVPGWEELATFTERRLGHPPSAACLRMVRSMALEALDATIADMNAMTIVAVVEALTDAARRPTEPDGDFLLAEYRWLKVGQIAKLFDLSPSRVTKLTDAGTFASNGKTGNDRRVDVLAVVRWTLTQLGEPGGASPRADD